MDATTLLKRLWDQYVEITPSAKKILDIFEEKGENVENDHIAIRTFNDPRVGIDVLSRPFIAAGYEPKGDYIFEKKKLKAKHFEHKTDKNAPKVFISELRLELCSEYIQEIVDSILAVIPQEKLVSEDLVYQGRIWGKPSFKIYEKLREESEYAAWMYIYGFRVNHFTIFINFLKNFESIQEVNSFLKEHGFEMNASGGEIKGTPEQLLEQSSILADKIKIDFQEGEHEVPSCYYEFAKRYPQQDGELYTGFIAASADKIFESTDASLQK